MKKILGVMVIFALTGLILAGCSGNKETAATQKEELIVAVATEPTNFVSVSPNISSDFDHIIFYNVYDSLFKKDWDQGGKVVPYLAESFEVSPSGTEIKVKIRNNVQFHDGTKLTSEDFKFTYDEMKKTPLGISLLINYDYTEVVDDLNFIIHMTDPFNAILNAFCSRVSPVISKAHWEKVGGYEGYSKNPIGTGAYKFVSVTSGDSIVLERNENWWGGKPYFKKVTVKTIPDVNTQIMAVEAGDVDVVIGIPNDTLDTISDPNVIWDATAANTTGLWHFNLQDNRWVTHDLNFRKAVQYGIDKEAINQAIYDGRATVIDIYGDPKYTGRPDPGTYKTFTYDPVKAKEYLAASNYKGQEFKVVTWAGNVTEKICQVIQGNLQDIGINMRLVATDTATYYDTVRNTGDFDVQYYTQGSAVTDLDSLANFFFISRYGFPNIMHGDKGEYNQILNDLCVAGRKEADVEKRKDIYRQVSDINTDNVFQIYTHVDLNTIVYRKGLNGVKADMIKYYRFAEWSY